MANFQNETRPKKWTENKQKTQRLRSPNAKITRVKIYKIWDQSSKTYCYVIGRKINISPPPPPSRKSKRLHR